MKPERNGYQRFFIIPFAISVALLALTLSGCSLGNGTNRPDENKLKDGIRLLVGNFAKLHPQLVTWKPAMVAGQLQKPLPSGFATEAGWTLIWKDPKEGELPRVVVPWSLIGQFPEKYQLDTQNYSGGAKVPTSVAADIRTLWLKASNTDQYFAGIVHLRYSTKDSSWLIFTSVPYLPVTDDAYGFAHLSGKSWKIIDFGTATVGCSVVPNAVQSEFGLSCP